MQNNFENNQPRFDRDKDQQERYMKDLLRMEERAISDDPEVLRAMALQSNTDINILQGEIQVLNTPELTARDLFKAIKRSKR